MKLSDFVRLTSEEQPRSVCRKVRTIALQGQPFLKLSDLSSLARDERETTFDYRHILGGPAPVEVVAAWQSKYGSLPDELRNLVTSLDGIHLWANSASGRSYTGICPLAEWELLRSLPGMRESFPDDDGIVISYHQDGAAYVVFRYGDGYFYLVDAAGPDYSCKIAGDPGELLDWLWKQRILPK